MPKYYTFEHFPYFCENVLIFVKGVTDHCEQPKTITAQKHYKETKVL